MYEDSDRIEGETYEIILGNAIHSLKEEITKIAIIIDKMQEEIDRLKNRT